MSEIAKLDPKSVQMNLFTEKRSGRAGKLLAIAAIILGFGSILGSSYGGDSANGAVKGAANVPVDRVRFFQAMEQSYGHKSKNQRYAARTSGDDNNSNQVRATGQGRLKPKLVQSTRVAAAGTNTRSDQLDKHEGQERIVPSLETNGNSQVVFVNLARVVSDKNETERFITKQPIQEGGQIGCGETNKNGQPSNTSANETLQNRIVGGNKAEPGEFPYQVRLNIRSRRGSSLCGGVIIDKRHILTAAHCMTTW